jgi:hypothetical protein
VKPVHTFPALFTLFLVMVPVWALVSPLLFGLTLGFLVVFSLMVLVDATRKERSLKVGLLSVVAAFVQLTGYGVGFFGEGWKRLREPRGFRETGATIEYPS